MIECETAADILLWVLISGIILIISSMIFEIKYQIWLDKYIMPPLIMWILVVSFLMVWNTIPCIKHATHLIITKQETATEKYKDTGQKRPSGVSIILNNGLIIIYQKVVNE
jgi:hypothetical protein